MASPRPLSHPPIAEALIDFRIAGGKKAVSELEPLAKSLQVAYPSLEVINEGQAHFQTREGKLFAEAKELGVQAYHLRSADRSRVVQLASDRFTFNRLPPYVSADEMVQEAMPVWDRYREAMEPEAVVRIAMRYINRLALPFRSGDEYSRFLTAAPQVPSEISQEVSEFLTRVVLQHPHNGGIVAIVGQKLTSVEADKDVPVVLDIDVFREGQFEPSTDHLAAVLTNLRKIKNEVFFSLLTEEAVNLYA
jgi:uncharacterized protein (TIGR04255 family)